jgi:hypothetical protein
LDTDLEGVVVVLDDLCHAQAAEELVETQVLIVEPLVEVGELLDEAGEAVLLSEQLLEYHEYVLDGVEVVVVSNLDHCVILKLLVSLHSLTIYDGALGGISQLLRTCQVHTLPSPRADQLIVLPLLFVQQTDAEDAGLNVQESLHLAQLHLQLEASHVEQVVSEVALSPLGQVRGAARLQCTSIFLLFLARPDLVQTILCAGGRCDPKPTSDSLLAEQVTD